MNVHRDPDAVLAAWLDENAIPLPLETRRAIGVAIETTPQRRRSERLLRRFTLMPYPLRFAAMAIVVLVVASGAFIFLRPSTDSGAGNPGASPTPTASESTAPDTSTWTSYTSPDAGFSASHPADWGAFPREVETFFSGGEAWTSGIAVARYPAAGLDQEVWLAANCGIRNGTYGNTADAITLVPCDPPLADWTATQVDGRDALQSYTPDGCCLDTLVFADDQVYVITTTSSITADRPLIDAFLSTLTLDPASP